MSNRRKKKQNTIPLNTPTLSLDDIDNVRANLLIKEQLLIEKGLNSSDPQQILKAQRYLTQIQEQQQEDIKSFLISPDNLYNNGNGFRQPTKSVTYNTLRRMARTPVIKTIINTRVDQVAGFAEPTTNLQEKGWTIRKKPSLFGEGKELNKKDQLIIEETIKFISNGGDESFKWSFDSFETYLRQIARDSYEIDQICMEMVPDRKGKLIQYLPVDGATMRILDVDSSGFKESHKEIRGYYPRYAQVYEDKVYAEFYPWEMSFGVRNSTTDIYSNQYGVSELEDMINIVTWTLFGLQYNGNFFSQGSNPKGFFTMKGTLAPNSVNQFKQNWRNTVSGVENAWKVPVIEAGQAEIDWINMQTSNKDMEFDKWMDFLILMSCCSFRIDPSEVGFNIQKAAQIFGQDGQKERLKHSQSKGLVPVLKLIQRLFNKYIVDQIAPGYEFIFTGIEVEDQVVALDMDVKKANSGFMSMEDGFKKWSGRDFDPESDTILNQTYFAQKQQEMMGGGYMNNEVNEDYPQEEQPQETNPFEKSLIDYLNKE